MATANLGLSPNLDIHVDYNGNNGKANGLTAINRAAHNVWVRATLANGTTPERTFGPGTTTMNFPANLVAVTIDGQGDPVFTGLARVETKDPA